MTRSYNRFCVRSDECWQLTFLYRLLIAVAFQKRLQNIQNVLYYCLKSDCFVHEQFLRVNQCSSYCYRYKSEYWTEPATAPYDRQLFGTFFSQSRWPAHNLCCACKTCEFKCSVLRHRDSLVVTQRVFSWQSDTSWTKSSLEFSQRSCLFLGSDTSTP